jgi:hypothetical protein
MRPERSVPVPTDADLRNSATERKDVRRERDQD